MTAGWCFVGPGGRPYGPFPPSGQQLAAALEAERRDVIDRVGQLAARAWGHPAVDGVRVAAWLHAANYGTAADLAEVVDEIRRAEIATT